MLFNVICNKQLLEETHKKYNVYKANYKNIERNLKDINWTSILKGDISEAYKIFHFEFEKALEENIPLQRKRSKKKNMFMTPKALRLKNIKNKLWKKYLISKSQVKQK